MLFYCWYCTCQKWRNKDVQSIKMFSGLWFVEQFKHICRQSINSIHVNFGRRAHYGTAQACLTLYSADFPPFPDRWFVEQLPVICRQSADRIAVKLGRCLGFPSPDLLLAMFSRIWPPPPPPQHTHALITMQPLMPRSCINYPANINTVCAQYSRISDYTTNTQQ